MSGSQVTPFLRLLKPPFDAVPWDEAINGNMDTIDAFIARYMAVPNYVGAWANSVQYISGQNVLDITDATIYQCLITHTSSAIPATFADDRATYPTYWAATTNVITGGTGNTNLTIGSATPLSAKAGDLWWDSVGGQLYILYNDGNSLQWVIANNQAGNVGEAPNDGNTYGRRNSAWTQVSTANVGRNLVHNPLFNIAQRGAGPWTANGLTTDRWGVLALAGDTVSATQVAMTDGSRTQIGDEAASFQHTTVFTGSAAAGANTRVYQSTESVRRLAGKTVIVSFWAAGVSGATKLGVSFNQYFGTGGSPSADVPITGQLVTLTTSYARYSLTFSIPSIIGKTVGTNNDNCFTLNFWYSSGATNNALSGGVGVQSGTISLWGVQLEVGNTATPLEKPDPQQDLAKCQRFYAQGWLYYGGYGPTGQLIIGQSELPVTMRAMPTIALQGSNGGGNVGSISVTSQVNRSTISWVPVTATGYGTVQQSYTASADL